MLRDRVTVHSSWRGLAAAVVSPLALIGFGAAVLLAGGLGPVAVLSLVVGAALGAVTLGDYPRRAVFTPAGIERVCFVRTQLLPWSEVVALERTPPKATAALRRHREDRPATGGLVARGFGKRRYLLTDRIEGREEFDAIAALLREHDLATNLRAARPSEDAPPSDLYRRGRRAPGQERT